MTRADFTKIPTAIIIYYYIIILNYAKLFIL